MSNAPQILELRNLKKFIFGFQIEASFEIAPSERIAIVGRSGVGKTTLLRLIAGLEPLLAVDSGQIWLAGREITRESVQKREIGFVFQEQALFFGRSVFENVAFGLKMRGVGRRDQEARVAEWLEKLRLKERAHEKVDHLSGGERQRVALARALIIRPRLILMDEPFTGLDPGLRESLCAEVRRLHQENPVPLLFVSHDESDRAGLATGKIVVEEFEGGAIRRALVRS